MSVIVDTFKSKENQEKKIEIAGCGEISCHYS